MAGRAGAGQVRRHAPEGEAASAGEGRPGPDGLDQRAGGDGGRSPAMRPRAGSSLRRLNRAEYENTVRDLLGVDIDLKDLLPPDTSANGFDNGAEALHVSSFLMEQYLEAADKVLDAAIANGPRPRMIKKRFDIKDEKSVKPTGSVYRHLDDGVAIFSSWVSANIQVTLWQFCTHVRGKYRFRISGVRLPDRQAGHLPRDGRHHDGGDRGAPRRLLRRAARQADRGRVRRAAGAEEHDPDRRGRAGRDPARGREGRGGQLQGAGAGRAVGGDRRAAARLLAAAEPSPHLRRPAAGAGADRRTTQPPSRSSRSSRWPTPSASSATSCAAPSGGP